MSQNERLENDSENLIGDFIAESLEQVINSAIDEIVMKIKSEIRKSLIQS